MSRLAILPFAFALLTAASAQETATFTDKELGLSFDHPSTWKVKRQKSDTIITIPIEGQEHTAKLELYSENYGAEAERWEDVQQQMSKQLRRELVRQWREEILGVPMLLSKVAYEDRTGRKMVLTGLLYSATPRKLFFKLTADAESFESVESELRTAMQSLRTTTGEIPQAEDPNREFDPVNLDGPMRPRGSTKVTRIEAKPNGPAKLVKGQVKVPAKVANREVVLHLPSGWEIAESAEGGFTARREGFPGSVKVELNALIDSASPQTALLRSSTEGLGAFKVVQLRTESVPKANAAGAAVQVVWRKGSGVEGGEMTTCEAYGALGDFYWLLTYRHAGALGKADREALEALVNGMSIEPAS